MKIKAWGSLGELGGSYESWEIEQNKQDGRGQKRHIFQPCKGELDFLTGLVAMVDTPSYMFLALRASYFLSYKPYGALREELEA